MSDFFAQFYGERDPSIVQELDANRDPRQDVVEGAWDPLLDLDAPALTRWMGQLLTPALPTSYLSLHGTSYSSDYRAWLRKRIPGAAVEFAPALTHSPSR